VATTDGTAVRAPALHRLLALIRERTAAPHAAIVGTRGEVIATSGDVPATGTPLAEPLMTEDAQVGTLLIMLPEAPADEPPSLDDLAEIAASLVGGARDDRHARSRSIELAQVTTEAVAGAMSLEEALRASVEALFQRAQFASVTGTVADWEAGEQVVVVDRTQQGPSATGLRRPLSEGLTGDALRTGREIVTGRALDHPLYAWPGPVHYPSLVLMPVVIDGRAEALIEVAATEPDAFDEDDAALLRTVAGQLAANLRGVRLRADLERRARQLEVASRVAAFVSRAETVEQALRLAARAVSEQAGYEWVGATLALHDSDEQIQVAELGPGGSGSDLVRRPLGEGLIGAAITSASQISVPDVRQDERFSWPREIDIRSEIVTPIVVEGRAVAAIDVCDRRTNQFDRFDAALISVIADQLAASWRGIVLRDESRRRTDRLTLACEVAKLVAEAATAEQLLGAVAQLVKRHTGAGNFTATLIDHQTGEQVFVADVSHHPEPFQPFRRSLDCGIVGEVLASGTQYISSRAAEDTKYSYPFAKYMSAIVSPLIDSGRCVGAIGLWDERRDRFDTWDAVLMETVAEQAAVAMRAIQLRQQSERHRAESDRRAARLALSSRIARRIAGASSAEDVLKTAADMVHETGEYAVVAGLMVSPDDSEQIVVALNGADEDGLVGLRRPVGTGLAGIAIKTGEQVLVGKAADTIRFSWPGAQYESALVTPVVVDGRTEAVLSLADLRHDQFDATHASLMQAVAEQAAAALRGVHLRHESERRAKRLSLAAQIAMEVADAAGTDEVLRTAVTGLASRIDCGSVAAFRALPDTGEMLAVIDIDRHGDSVEGQRRPIGAGDLGRAFTTGQPLLRSAAQEQDPGARSGAGWTHRSALMMPVRADGDTVAVLSLLDARPDRFDEDDVLLMQTVAEQLAAAIRGARLRNESARRARRLDLALDVAKAVAGSGSADDILRAAVQTISRHFDCGATAGFLAVPGDQQLVVVDVDRHDNSVEGMRRELHGGSSGHVFETRQQLLLGAGDEAAAFDPWVDTGWRYSSVLATAVLVDGVCEAVIALYDKAQDRFDADDAVLMQTIAEQVATALRGAGLRAESEARAKRLGLVLEAARAVAGADTVDDALTAVVDTIFARTRYAAAAAIRIDHESNEEIVVRDRARIGTPIQGMRRPLTPYGTGLAAVSKRQLRFGQTTDDPRYLHWLPEAAWGGVLVTPVVVNDVCQATLVLYTDEASSLEESDEVLMETVAEQVAAHLRSIALRDQSEARATRLEALERRQRGLLERLVRAQEQERSQVAGDLHDDTVQVLAACVIGIDRIRRSIGAGELDRAGANLRDVADLLAGAVDRTRRMTFELRPAVLWHHGLEPAVARLLDALAAETGAVTRLVADRLPERFDVTTETIAFRSIRELIANIRTHANAQMVTVELSVEDSTLTASVSDDGQGFDVEGALRHARATNHLGLEAMIERIDAAGGTIDLDAAPGKGTRVTLTLPIRIGGATGSVTRAENRGSPLPRSGTDG
jgi:GAF domain-containing protein